MSLLQIGKKAPLWTLPRGPQAVLSLKNLYGTPIVLVFYPADWSPVCSDQLSLYNELEKEFQKYQAKLVAISVDGIWCHQAFLTQRKLFFPLLSDFEPKGKVAREYGVYLEKEGFSGRALFVLDADGVIGWHYLAPTGINPGAEGIFLALQALPS